MPDLVRCPRCGATQSAAELGVCPACLLRTALATADDPFPYRVLAPMGEDAAGTTFLAERLTPRDQIIALKIYRAYADPHAAIERFAALRPALRALRHPGVSSVLDVGTTEDGLLFIASKYIPGWPMSTLGSRELSGADRSQIGRQLTDSVDAIHAAGLAHLDLDETKVKISTADGVRATILGAGTELILTAVEPDFEADRRALSRILQSLAR